MSHKGNPGNSQTATNMKALKLRHKQEGWKEWRKTVIYHPPPLPLDGTVGFQSGWAILVPSESGVYFIHDLRGFLYIGRAKDLNVRFNQHYWGSHNPGLKAALHEPLGSTQFSWIVSSREEAADLEKRYIRAFQPITNVIRYTPSKPKEGK